MRALAFTGLPGSGKSEAVSVACEMGLSVVNMGDAVRAETRKRGLLQTDEYLGQVATEMRQQYGMDVWTHHVLEHIEQNVRNQFVIDGIRTIEEIETFRQNINKFILVAVHASPQSRYQHLKQRARSDDPMSEQALRRRDERELGWGLGNVIAMADAVIVNEGSLEEFRKKVRHFVKGVLSYDLNELQT